MKPKAKYTKVGPVDRLRAESCLAVLDQAIERNKGKARDDSPELKDRVLNALRSISADMPYLRYHSVGTLMDIEGAIHFIDHDWGSVSYDFMRHVAAAIRKVLSGLPDDVRPNEVILTVGQLRSAFAGLDDSLPAELDIIVNGEAAKFRISSVQTWGAGEHRGVSIVQYEGE